MPLVDAFDLMFKFAVVLNLVDLIETEAEELGFLVILIYFELTYPVFVPYFTLYQLPLFDRYETVFPFGMVVKMAALVEAVFRKFKLAFVVYTDVLV